MDQDLAKWEAQEALRKAEVAYITDSLRRSLEWWWKEVAKDHITWIKFQERAQRGRWARRRDQYWIDVQQKVLLEAQQIAIRDRVAELRELQQIRANTMELILPEVSADGTKTFKVQPTSYEGCVRALVQLDAHIEFKRDSTIKMIEPHLVGASHERKSAFTPEEVRTVARALLESRRAGQVIDVVADDEEDGK